MPKEIIERKSVRKNIKPTELPSVIMPKVWRLKRLSQLINNDPSLWGISWAFLWRAISLLLIFRVIISAIRAVLYKLANVS